MTWLALAWFISIGTLNQEALLSPPYATTPPYSSELPLTTPPHSSEATLGATLEVFNDHLEVGGSVKTSQTFDSIGVYSPFLADYGAFARVKYGPLSLVIVHHCIHGVENPNPVAVFPLEQVYTTVAIELHGRTKLF